MKCYTRSLKENETSRNEQHTLECALETLRLSLAERSGRVGCDVVVSRHSGDGRRPHGGVRSRRVGHGAAIRGRRSDELRWTMLSVGLASTQRARLIDPRAREAGLKEDVRSVRGQGQGRCWRRAVAAAGETGPDWEDASGIVRLLLITMRDSAAGYEVSPSDRRRSVMGWKLMRGGQCTGDASAGTPASQTPKLLDKSLDMARREAVSNHEDSL